MREKELQFHFPRKNRDKLSETLFDWFDWQITMVSDYLRFSFLNWACKTIFLSFCYHSRQGLSMCDTSSRDLFHIFEKSVLSIFFGISIFVQFKVTHGWWFPSWIFRNLPLKAAIVRLVAVIARNRVELPKKFRRVNLKQRNQTSP